MPPTLACSVPQVTFQQICKDVHLVKHQGQQLFIESRARPPARPRLPGQWVRVWVRTETWGSPDFRPNPEELVSPFSLLGLATGTFKAKTLSCQSPDPELEMVPAPLQAPLALSPEEAERKDASTCSYQQINCLDSILR